METTSVPISTVPPPLSTRSRHRSHIIPGPNLGYWNSSMRLVICCWLRFGVRALSTALPRSRFLIRWAAQSEGISLTGTPQTFSV